MRSSILSRGHNAAAHPAAQHEPLSICLVGGIYGKSEEYRAKVKMAPEIILENGLKARGHTVVTQGHGHRLKIHGMDIVHVHHIGYGALRMAAASGEIPFIYTSHESHAISGMLNLSRRMAADFVMSRADAVVALSLGESEFQRKTFSLAGAAQTIIPNGISAEIYQYSRSNGAGEGQRWKLLFVGQLIELKGVDRLLRALAMLPPNIELRLVFHVDTLRGRLEQLVRELGLQNRVFFLGSKNPEELRSLYQQSDLFVLPSLVEVLPSVVTEAMLCGTPVVASDVGGIRDQLGGFGMVVPPQNVEALAHAIGDVLSRYDQFRARGEAMSQYAAQRFSIPAMIESHLELYRSLLRKKGVRRRNYFFCWPMNMAANLTVRLLCKT